MHSVDIIIPAYKPGEKFIKLLDMLEKQTYPIQRVIVVNTEEKYFDRLLFFEPRRKFREKMTVRHISKSSAAPASLSSAVLHEIH